MANLKIINRLIIFGVGALLSHSSFAATIGPYIGLQLGWGDVNQGKFIEPRIEDSVKRTIPGLTVNALHIGYRDTGRGGRIYLGYQFNTYIAAELGYSRFTSLNFRASMDGNVKLLQELGVEIPAALVANIRVNTDAFDLVMKAMYPVTEKFSIYGKLGLASLNSLGAADLTLKTPLVDLSIVANPSINLIYPVIGLGMQYQPTEHVGIDLAVTRIQKVDPCLYPSIDMATVGIIYYF